MSSSGAVLLKSECRWQSDSDSYCCIPKLTLPANVIDGTDSLTGTADFVASAPSRMLAGSCYPY